MLVYLNIQLHCYYTVIQLTHPRNKSLKHEIFFSQPYCSFLTKVRQQTQILNHVTFLKAPVLKSWWQLSHNSLHFVILWKFVTSLSCYLSWIGPTCKESFSLNTHLWRSNAYKIFYFVGSISVTSVDEKEKDEHPVIHVVTDTVLQNERENTFREKSLSQKR